MPLPTALVYACQRICGIGFGLAIYGHKKQARGQQQHQASIQTMAHSMRRHKVEARVYEVRPRKDHRGVDLVSDALPIGRLWYGKPNTASNAVGYAKFTAGHTML